MKRLLCFILIIALMVPAAFAGEEEMVLSVSEAVGGVGDTVTVVCKVANAPECASFRIILNYDDTCLSPLSGAIGSGVAGQTSINTSATFEEQGAVVAISASNNVSFSGDTELFTVEFEIIAEPESGCVLPLSVAHQEFFSPDLVRISPAVISGNVFLDTYLPGDINSDLQIDLLDVLFLLQKLSGNLSEEQETHFFLVAADVADTGDNEVNAADASRLLQYITGVREEGAAIVLHKASVVPTVTV